MASTLTPQEARIMGMWDAGASLDVIACNMGMNKERVGKIVAMFDIGDGGAGDKAAMRRGSAFLLKAIQLTGKRHRSVVRPVGLAL